MFRCRTFNLGVKYPGWGFVRISVSCIRVGNSWPFSLTPTLSRWEREPVRPRFANPNGSLSPHADDASPSPSGRGLG